MALWKKYVVTDVGRALLARSIAHQTEMRISGISTSAKSYSTEVLDSLTALEDIRQSFPVVSEEVVNRSTVKVTANITNKDLAEGYNLTTLGVYATGYDSVEPVLFAVSVAEKPDFLEAGQNGMIRSILTSIYLKTDNAKDISIQVDMDAYVTKSLLAQVKEELLNLSHPIGSVYISMNDTHPATLFGGTWEALPAGRVLLGQGQAESGTVYQAGLKGGAERHTLSVDEMPRHSHPGNTQNADISGDFRTRSNTFYGKGADSILGRGVTTRGRFSVTQSGLRSEGNADDNRTEYICHFDGNHSHGLSIEETGGGQAHSIMQPYLVAYMWRRTA